MTRAEQRFATALAALHTYGGRVAGPTADDTLVTHRTVVDTLPASIRNDFLPPAEQDYAYVCSHHPSGGFLVPTSELRRLDQYA